MKVELDEFGWALVTPKKGGPTWSICQERIADAKGDTLDEKVASILSEYKIEEVGEPS